MVRYYHQGKWREGVVISPKEYNYNIDNAYAYAKRFYGGRYSYIKVEGKRGVYKIYGVPKKTPRMYKYEVIVAGKQKGTGTHEEMDKLALKLIEKGYDPRIRILKKR